MRFTVEVAGDKLHRYVTWLERPKGGLHRALYHLRHVRLWYVYAGSVSPSATSEIAPA